MLVYAEWYNGRIGLSHLASHETWPHNAAVHVQADDPDLQQDGLGNKGKGRSGKGQGRWLSRWLARDGSSRKQGKEKVGSKKPEGNAPQQHLETKSLELRKAPAAAQGPGKPMHPCEGMTLCAWLAVHDLPRCILQQQDT